MSVAAKRLNLRLGCGSVVANLQSQLVMAICDDDGRRRRARLGRGVERLLEDAIGREVDPGRQLDALALQLDRHLEPQPAGSLDKMPGLRERGLRRERALVLGMAQDAEKAAHLGQRIASRLLDQRQRLGGLHGLAGGDRPRHRLGLHHHRAHPIGHDGLKLAGNPYALVLDRTAGSQLTLPLEVPRSSAELVLDPAAIAKRASDDRGGAAEKEQPQVLAGSVDVAAEQA